MRKKIVILIVTATIVSLIGILAYVIVTPAEQTKQTEQNYTSFMAVPDIQSTIKVTPEGAQPQQVTVTAGRTVIWANSDSSDVEINITALNSKSGVIRPNKTYKYQFDQPGIYEYADATNKVLGKVEVK